MLGQQRTTWGPEGREIERLGTLDVGNLPQKRLHYSSVDTNLSTPLGAGVAEVLEICSAENVRKTFKVGFHLYLKDGTKWFKFEIFDWSHSTSSREEK